MMYSELLTEKYSGFFHTFYCHTTKQTLGNRTFLCKVCRFYCGMIFGDIQQQQQKVMFINEKLFIEYALERWIQCSTNLHLIYLHFFCV